MIVQSALQRRGGMIVAYFKVTQNLPRGREGQGKSAAVTCFKIGSLVRLRELATTSHQRWPESESECESD